jgi:hypothetical protein
LILLRVTRGRGAVAEIVASTDDETARDLSFLSRIHEHVEAIQLAAQNEPADEVHEHR